MTDITKCEWDWCTVKYKCYRYTAESWLRQSFFMGIPWKDRKCEYFYPLISEEMSNEILVNHISKTVRICSWCHSVEEIKELKKEWEEKGYTISLYSCGKYEDKILEF